MKEEDIMKIIRDDSDNLQIPDSLSPENIEKMLNEHVANKTDDNSKVTQFPARKKLAIAIAACFGLIIAGSGAIGLINRNQNSETTAVYEEAAEATGNDALKEEAASAEAADETADYFKIRTCFPCRFGSSCITIDTTFKSTRIKLAYGSAGTPTDETSYTEIAAVLGNGAGICAVDKRDGFVCRDANETSYYMILRRICRRC